MTPAEHEVHAAHAHDHGPGCGHASVQREGHTDQSIAAALHVSEPRVSQLREQLIDAIGRYVRGEPQARFVCTACERVVRPSAVGCPCLPAFRARCRELRSQGFTWDKIAFVLQCSQRTARKAVEGDD